jgi:hypothetical protein
LCVGKYRLDHDPAADPGDPDPWSLVLPGRYGEVYPFGRDRLAVEVYDGRVALAVAAVLGGVLPYQRGHQFFAYLFHPDRLEAVASIIQPPKVRRLSPAARDRLALVRGGTQFGAPGNGTQALS